MQSTIARALILAALIGLAQILIVLGSDHDRASPRFPASDERLYAAAGWRAGPLSVESAHGVDFVTRAYERPDARAAVLTIATSPDAKRIYRTDGSVPFLGSGYTTEYLPPQTLALGPGMSALVARQGGSAILVIEAHGERRGLVGGGIERWGPAIFDAALARENDFYALRITAPFEPASATELGRLAGKLFSDVATWYSRPP